MPSIEVNRTDLESLLGEKLNFDRLTSLLPLVKGEIKEWTEETLKLELNDSNRPDLWSPEGIARQNRLREKGESGLGGTVPPYPFFEAKAYQKIIVSKSVTPIRPYLGAFLVRGITITDAVLIQLIQSQEKLAEIFGQKRKTLSIGLYPLQKIVFPIRYDVADPDTTCFTPLGVDQPISMREILKGHPKGMTYADILKDQTHYPILIDAKDQILSFPPIINSREVGELHVGDTDFLVEVTGCNLRMVILAVNIFACNLFDRGGAIEPLSICFPQETPFGRSIKMPYDADGPVPFSKRVEVTLGDFEKTLGEPVSFEEARSFLTLYGYQVSGRGKKMQVILPPYRDDVMHPIDVVEDFAISRGYETFTPTMPSTATIGSQSPSSLLSRKLAEAMVGFGFEEVISNVLSSQEEQIDRMRINGQTTRPEGRVVLIENPMTERYAMPRPWLLPSLLRVEGVSSKAYYPHRLFEIGEVARLTKAHDGCETVLHLATLVAHAEARFSELHAVLSALFYSLSIAYQLTPIAHPTFIEGRAGVLLKQGQEIGFIGEVHPEVLTRWEIGVPAVAFEIETRFL